MIERRLDPYFSKVTGRRARAGLPAPQVLVDRPQGQYAHGRRDQPFHSASAGKLVTTAVILQETERDLNLGSLVEDLLPESRGLFKAPGATVEHLLSHTAGLPDTLEGKDGLLSRYTTQPDRVWSPQEHLEFARSHRKPVGLPGEKYQYSDVGFMLLGLLIEKRLGVGLAEAFQERVFAPLGMTDTVLWGFAPGPEKLAPAWVKRTEVSSFPSIRSDWAAGGLATTVDDLVRLARGVGDGTIVSPESYRQAITPRHRFHRGMWYGLGTMQLRAEGFAPWLRGLPRFAGHLGISGVHATYHRATDTAIAMNFHSFAQMPASVRAHIAILQALGRTGE